MSDVTPSSIPCVSIAPMMDRTDRHFRMFMRTISRSALLYSEMVTTSALDHGDRERHLDFSEPEHPLVLQVGGDDPEALARSARLAEKWGYDEININVGCPSDRVKKGCFGASLMARPEVVAAGVEAMRKACSIPVTVKHRIGIDDLDRYEDMANFVRVVTDAGCTRFTVHARKAWLNGLSPKENRTIPPLRYDDVYRLKAEMPELFVEINGGIVSMEEIQGHLHHVDAVMIGRAAYDNPWMLSRVDAELFGVQGPSRSPHEAIEQLVPYADLLRSRGERLHRLTRHLHNIFSGLPGSRAWKRHLGEVCAREGAGPETLLEGLKKVPNPGLSSEIAACG